MKKIEELDKNFAVPADTGAQLLYIDCLQPPFQVCGLLSTPEGFVRMPPDIAAAVSENVAALNCSTAGGRVRFRTDSAQIAIRAQLGPIGRMPHFALTGSAGFDLYADNVYAGTYVPPMEMVDGYESVLTLPEGGEKEILLHFPLYSGVKKLEIGLCPGAVCKAPAPYRGMLPVVYYGSSITQGGCASRPGNCYQNILSRQLHCDHINLGFSGSALAEEAMADYIAGLPMAVFVCDYDHNAPSADYLRRTHQKLFLTVRQKQPQLPVILLSRPQPNPTPDDRLRRDIIRETFAAAGAAGDRQVYFVDGSTLLHTFGGDGGTVDNCHPNDLGFACMAQGLASVLQRLL